MGRERDGAISPLLGFIAAIGIYVFALAVFLQFTSTPPTESSTIDADLQNRAGSALDLVITESGGDWVSDPDAMTRFGLASGEANFIDYDAVAALREGKMAADSTNGLPDYPEVKDALGLMDHQFHIRTYPVLIGIDDANWERMRGFRVAYLGDATDETSSATVSDSVTVDGNVRIYKVTITNDDPQPMIFTGNFDIAVTDTKDVSTTRQTPLLDGTLDTLTPGDSDRSWTWEIKIHPMKRWDDEPLEIVAAIADNYGACGDDEGCEDESESVTPYEHNTISYEIHYLAETDRSYYVEDVDDVTIKVDHFDRGGGKTTGQDARLRVYPPSAAGSLTQSATAVLNVQCSVVCPSINPGPAPQLPKNNNQEWEYECAAATCASTWGLWKVVVTPPSDDTRDTTFYYWVDDALLFGKPPLDVVAATEVGYVNDIVDGDPDAGDFDTDVWDDDSAVTLEGDVFIDTNQEVTDLVPYIKETETCDSPTRRYDMLIVGSNSAHNALVKIKDDVGSFVDCGGTLIALGSSRSGTEWLQEVYNIALRDGAGGGISSPDPTHPLLNVPEKLAWNSYSDTDYVWDISQNPGLFSHAVDGGTADELMLGVSEQGSLPGSVVLTGWTPGALTDPPDPDEARRLLHNLMSQGYQMLFLDYGPEIPDGTPVGSSSRLAAVQYVDLEDAPYVEVKVVFYTWRG